MTQTPGGIASRRIHDRVIAAAVVVGLACAAGTDARAQVSGRVRTQVGGLPVAGAIVSLQATTQRDTTAADGTFELPGATGWDLKIVAAKKGFYNRGITVASTPMTGLDLRLSAVPQDNNPSYTFVEPTACGVCHQDQIAQWTGSPMSLAGQNRWMYDVYDGSGTAGGAGGFVYQRDSHYAGVNPESECASCHQPEAWIKQPFRGLQPLDSLGVDAIHGVSCEVCHKIANIDETRKDFPGIWPGVVTYTRPNPASGPVIYGVLGDTDISWGPMRPSYQPQLTSAVCCACHQDRNDPDQDRDFAEPNGVIAEPTYNEWLASPYGDPASSYFASCAKCHMPEFGSYTACAVAPVIRDPATIRSHRIVGTTPEFLENSATLALDAQWVGGNLAAEARVTNSGAGHSLPTGVPIRNIILRIDAWRESDGLRLTPLGTQTIDSLGGVGNPAQGYLAGLPGKLYGKKTHDMNGAFAHFFTEATGVLWDTRIAALETDTTRYTFAPPPGGGVVHVRAQLIYRRAFRYLIDAKNWSTDGHGNALADIAPPHYGHLMEEVEWVSGTTSVAGTAAGEGGARIELLACDPNPAPGATRFRFRLADAAAVRVRIFDVRGREVGTAFDGRGLPGFNEVEWRGQDREGRRVPSGVYLYALEVDGRIADSRRLVMVR